MLLSIGMFKRKVSDVANTMLDAVHHFSKKHQTSDLALIQIVIFDSSMCDGFARAIQSAVKHSNSIWGRAKRKCAEVSGKFLLQRINDYDYIFNCCVIVIITRNKSNDYFESLRYRQDLFAVTHCHKRKHFPSYKRCTDNHNNTCTENRKIRGLKFDTLYWRHLYHPL